MRSVVKFIIISLCQKIVSRILPKNLEDRMSFDIAKVQKSLRENGVDEESWANELVLMLAGQSVQGRMYAHRMVGEIFTSPRLNSQKKELGMLDEFGMESLTMTVQESRRLGVQEAEVVVEDSN